MIFFPSSVGLSFSCGGVVVMMRHVDSFVMYEFNA